MQNQPHRNICRQNKSLNKLKMEGTYKAQLIMPTLRSKDQGNHYSITTNISNYSSNKEGNKMEDNYIKRIKYLQNQLKKKIMDDMVLRNLFKIKVPPQITHLDIYLEIRRLQETIRDQAQMSNNYKQKVIELQNSMRNQEEQHMRYIQILGESIEQKEMQWRSQKHQLEDFNRQLQEKYENNRFLLQEIKKKYGQLNQKYKDLTDQLQIQRSANNLGILQCNQQNQAKFNQFQIEIQQRNQKINELQKNIEDLRCKKEDDLRQEQRRALELQQIKDERQKLQLRINEMEQICRDYDKSIKLQRERSHQQLQKLKRHYQSNQYTHIRKHQQQVKKYQERQHQLQIVKDQMQNSIQILEEKLRHAQQDKAKIEKDISNYIQRQKSFEKQLANLEKKNVKLSIQLMQVRCEKDEQSKLFAKERIQLEDKQNMMRNSQSRNTHKKAGSDLKSEIQRKYFRS